MFFKREYTSEIMDDFSIRDSRIDNALYELTYINKYLGGLSVTKEGISKLLLHDKEANPASDKPGKKLTVIDMGAGASDILQSLKNDFELDIISIDKNPRASLYLKNNSTITNIICADVFKLPVNIKADIIHCSLFLHHFTSEQIIMLLTTMIKFANNGIVINDLRRSVIAYVGIKLLTSIFSRSRMVKNDGPLSVKRGFIKADLLKILNSIPGINYTIKRKWAFRWLVIIQNDYSR